MRETFLSSSSKIKPKTAGVILTSYLGYAGNLLYVNLENGKIRRRPVTDELARAYLGGLGFGVKILYDELRPGIDPLGPENKLVFASGPLGGTRIPFSGYYMACGKSCETGLFLGQPLASRWAMSIKQAGYDALVVEGKAEKPAFIWIDDGTVEIRDAGHLWGKGTYECEEEIRKDLYIKKRKRIRR